MSESRFQWIRVKTPSPDVALSSFRQTRFFPAASLRFCPLRYSFWCKLGLQPEQSLTTSSYFSMSMSIAFTSLLHRSLKRKGRPRTFLPVVPFRRTFGILPSGIQYTCPNQQWSLVSFSTVLNFKTVQKETRNHSFIFSKWGQLRDKKIKWKHLWKAMIAYFRKGHNILKIANQYLH